MKKLKIGNLMLGEGMPKICIPLTGSNEEEILKEIEFISELPCQMVEWRADYMLKEIEGDDPQRQSEKLKQVLGYIRIALDLPVIFTIRTDKEGGEAAISREDYFFINTRIAESKMADVIDIEVFEAPGQVDERRIRRFLENVRRQGGKVLLSSHDFEKTPDLEEILARFFLMQDLGADLMKLAVMPQSENDVFRLLEGAALMRDTYGKIPFIAISMGELGATTRICGGEFGSVVTFAAGKGASAPGQIDAVTLQEFLMQYY